MGVFLVLLLLTIINRFQAGYPAGYFPTKELARSYNIDFKDEKEI